MGCGTTCLKCILILLNSILAVIGLLMFAGGIALKVNPDLVLTNPVSSQYITPYINQFFSSLQSQANSTYGNNSTALDISTLTPSFGYVLIVIGGALALVSILGALGACCSNKCFLILYCILLILVIAAQICVVIAFFVGGFNTIINTLLKPTVQTYIGIGNSGSNAQSVTWDIVMIHFNCCGINGVGDFPNTSDIYSLKNSFNGIPPGPLASPLACCKFNATYYPIYPQTCATTPTNQTANLYNGCFGAIQTWLGSSNIKSGAIGVICAVIILQGLLLVFTIIIYRSIGHKEK